MTDYNVSILTVRCIMKKESFLMGVVVGAAAAFLVTKEVLKKCKASADESAIKNAEGVAEQSRAASEDLMNQLKTHIEAEQTLSAECDDLKVKVNAQNKEIEDLKNACAMQDGCNKKLEEEIASLKNGK